jgi:UDP-N-acetylglucosamine 2-epimerase
LLRRQKDKEFELQKTFSDKLRFQEERDKMLKVTKERYESQTENFINELSEKLNKVEERVNFYFIYNNR